jgi:hypothetical protein
MIAGSSTDLRLLNPELETITFAIEVAGVYCQ